MRRPEWDRLFNICILISKKIINQKRGKRSLYSIAHFDALVEIEREADEIYAIQNDKVEMYEYK